MVITITRMEDLSPEQNIYPKCQCELNKPLEKQYHATAELSDIKRYWWCVHCKTLIRGYQIVYEIPMDGWNRILEPFSLSEIDHSESSG